MTLLLPATLIAPAAGLAQVERTGAITYLTPDMSNEIFLLEPSLEDLAAGGSDRMTLGVSVGSVAARVLREAFEKRQPLGDLVLLAAEDGAILVVAAADGPMPQVPERKVYHIALYNARVVDIRRRRSDEKTVEAITLAYDARGEIPPGSIEYPNLMIYLPELRDPVRAFLLAPKDLEDLADGEVHALTLAVPEGIVAQAFKNAYESGQELGRLSLSATSTAERTRRLYRLENARVTSYEPSPQPGTVITKIEAITIKQKILE